MIRIYKKTIEDKKLREIKEFEKGSWVHVVNPTERELYILEKDQHLEKGLLSDALDPYEVPRLEVEDGSIYVFASYPKEAGERIGSSPLTLVLGKECIYTIVSDRCEFLEDIIENGSMTATTHKTKFIGLIFSKIIGKYNRVMLDINKSVHKISLQEGKITNKDIIKLVSFEETLNIFQSDLKPISMYLNTLLSGRYLKLYEEDKELIEDLLLSASQIVEISETTVKVISNTREAYTAILSNNLNQVMKVLTVATVILTVPTIISSIFGMNVILPLGVHPNAFTYIISTIIIVILTLIIIFKKNDWI